jgi:hypothetical protein
MQANNINKLVRNEQILRDKNTTASKSIKKYFKNDRAVRNSPIQFICECSVLDCDEHVSISIDCYTELHKRADYFVIYKTHNTPAVETIVERHDTYDVVEKTKTALSQAAN